MVIDLKHVIENYVYILTPGALFALNVFILPFTEESKLILLRDKEATADAPPDDVRSRQHRWGLSI